MHPRPAIILLVEHNQMLRVVLRDVLEFAGWYVKEANTIYACAMLEQREHFDLLVIR